MIIINKIVNKKYIVNVIIDSKEARTSLFIIAKILSQTIARYY